jgi:hypothetical protein
MPRPIRSRRVIGALILLAVMGSAFAAPATAAETLRGSFQGAAWGNSANAKAGEIATQLGRSAYVPCGCHGTGGAVLTNGEDQVEAGDTYRSGKLVSTAQAVKQPDQTAFGRTTSRVTNINALGGLLKVASIDAIATVNATSSTIRANADGSAVSGVQVNGESQAVSRGERINLPGFGYVAFHLVTRYGDGTNVRGVRVDMMKIFITRKNTLDIPVGSVITAGHAEVGYVRKDPYPLVSAAAWGTEGSSSSHSVDNGLGRSAVTYLECLASGQKGGANSVNWTNVPGVLETGVNVNDVYGSVDSARSVATARSRIKYVDLLNGVLTADVIRGVATATADGAGMRTSFNGSRFVNLRILGQLVGDNVAPNTQIPIPGLGTLTLYATSSQGGSTYASATVNMVILKVTALNDQGLPVGTEIRIARAGAMVGN